MFSFFFQFKYLTVLTFSSFFSLFFDSEINSTQWGGLVSAEVLKIGDFIDTFRTNKTRQTYYLHDWSLPRDCPQIMGDPPYREFLMPRYFAGK